MFSSARNRHAALSRLGIHPSEGVLHYVVAGKIYSKGWEDEKNTPVGSELPGPTVIFWDNFFNPVKQKEIYQAGVRDFAIYSVIEKGPTNAFTEKGFLTGTEKN